MSKKNILRSNIILRETRSIYTLIKAGQTETIVF